MKIMTSTCICCGQTKTKIQQRDGKKFRYVDENNTLWLGKYCPDCKKNYYTSIRRPKPPITKNCKVCGTEFQTKNPKVINCSKSCATKTIRDKRKEQRRKYKNCITCGKPNTSKSKYCSKECQPSKPKKQSIEYKKTCPTCKIEFTTTSKRKTYCKKKHGQGEINHRKAYNKTLKAKQLRAKRKKVEKFKQPISKKYKKEIMAIYENKPLGQHVDHIIPINHPDVCGLHVPWNLTYFDANENTLKSNQFDYTMDNIRWKNFRKVG